MRQRLRRGCQVIRLRRLVRFIMKRLSMRGFLVLDYTKTRGAVQALGGWIRKGKLMCGWTCKRKVRLFCNVHHPKGQFRYSTDS